MSHAVLAAYRQHRRSLAHTRHTPGPPQTYPPTPSRSPRGPSPMPLSMPATPPNSGQQGTKLPCPMVFTVRRAVSKNSIHRLACH